jgi:hypothetical protein
MDESTKDFIYGVSGVIMLIVVTWMAFWFIAGLKPYA